MVFLWVHANQMHRRATFTLFFRIMSIHGSSWVNNFLIKTEFVLSTGIPPDPILIGLTFFSHSPPYKVTASLKITRILYYLLLCYCLCFIKSVDFCCKNVSLLFFEVWIPVCSLWEFFAWYFDNRLWNYILIPFVFLIRLVQ